VQPEIEIITPIGELCTPKTIGELCYDSVNQILNASDNKKLYISWSGGIDSTLVLAEFLKIVPKDRIVVLMNDYSIQEYTHFYKTFIDSNNKNVFIIICIIYFNFLSGNIIIHE
jgi:NH3-dependent NAD+ synthetase